MIETRVTDAETVRLGNTPAIEGPLEPIQGRIEIIADALDPDRASSFRIQNITAALSKAQSQVKEVKRNLTGHMPTKSGGYPYKYAGLDEVCAATKLAQVDNGLCLFTPLEGGNKIRVFLLHVSGEWLNFGVYPLDASHQHVGGSISYGRRYLEGLVYKVSPQDDDDARAATEHYNSRTPPPAPQKPATRTRPRSDSTQPSAVSSQQSASNRQPPADPRQPTAGSRQPKPQQPAQPNFTTPPGWPDTPVADLHEWIKKLPGWPAMRLACGILFGKDTPIKDTNELVPLWDGFYQLYSEKFDKLSDEQRGRLMDVATAVEDTRGAMDTIKQASVRF